MKRGRSVAGPSRGILSIATGGKVEKSAKSKAGIHIPGGQLPSRLFQGSKVLNRGKVREKAALSNADFDVERLLKSEESEEEEKDVQQKHQQEGSQVKTQAQVKLGSGSKSGGGGGRNLMGALLSSGKAMVLTAGGNFVPVVEEQSRPKIKMALEELETKLKEKVKWNCSCSKFLQSEAAAIAHMKQAEICFGGRSGQRMLFKATACKVTKERVFSDEAIKEILRANVEG